MHTPFDPQPSPHLSAAADIARLAGTLAERTEGARRIAPETLGALREARLLRALQPRAHGGLELGLADWLSIVARLSGECASTGWVYSVLSAHAAAVAAFPEEAQREVWGGDGEALVSSALAPTATARRLGDGYRVSGRWGFSSGCDVAQWVLAGARVSDPGAGEPAMIFCLVPMEAVRIEDDWSVMGLCGTGSKSLIGEDIAVPGHRVTPFRRLFDGAPGPSDGPAYYAMPRHAWAPCGLAAVGAGIALGMVDTFIAHIESRRSMSGRPLAEMETLQLKISESSAEAETALRILKADCREAAAAFEEEGALAPLMRARNRRDQAFATRLATSAVDRLYAAAGAHALFNGGALQRGFRDMHAVAAQIVLNFDAAGKSHAQLRLGRQPDDLLF